MHALTAEHRAAFSACLCQCLLHAIESGLVDQRANQRAVGQRVANGNALVDFFQACQQRVGHRAVHDQAAQ